MAQIQQQIQQQAQAKAQAAFFDASEKLPDLAGVEPVLKGLECIVMR